MKKTVAVIQARMGSSRLPLKMMLSLHSKPIIEWVLKRVEKSKLLDEIIVAIPDSKKDDILANYIKKLNFKLFRGSEDDVLGRFYNALKGQKAGNIVRICADNPLICPQEIDNLIEFFNQNSCDYAYNHIPKNNLYPDGLGAEIISFENLKKAFFEARDKKHREHCMSYITDNPDRFIIKTFNPFDKALHHPELKFDIDTIDDYLYLASKEYDIDIRAKDLIELFKENR